MKPIYLKPDQDVMFVEMKEEPSSGIRKSPFVKSGLEDGHGRELKSPFRPGEICYVREAWRIGAWAEDDGDFCIDYKDGPRKVWLHVDGDDYEQFERLWMESCDDADAAGAGISEEGNYVWEIGESPCRWRSPVTMPEWASRRHVRIVSCEPMNIKNISLADIEALGFYDDRATFNATRQFETFMQDWIYKHPGKEWAWRVEVEEVKG